MKLIISKKCKFHAPNKQPFFPLEANYGDAVLPESIMQQAGASAVLKDRAWYKFT